MHRSFTSVHLQRDGSAKRQREKNKPMEYTEQYWRVSISKMNKRSRAPIRNRVKNTKMSIGYIGIIRLNLLEMGVVCVY